jgi:hypothetical protein
MGDILTERRLEFNFSTASRAIRFDDNRTHHMSHCMKSVDFLVEWQGCSILNNILIILHKILTNFRLRDSGLILAGNISAVRSEMQAACSRVPGRIYIISA